MKLSRATLLPAVALLLVACASTKDFQAPRLNLVSASMLSADVFSQQFRVRVHVQNPNPRALPIKKLDFKLFLEGDSFGEGQSQAPFVVPANGETEFDLLVGTNFSISIARLLSRLAGTDRRDVEYIFSGTVTVDVAFSPKIKFNEAGRVDLSRR
jgi:LEA14-like dessication related protein